MKDLSFFLLNNSIASKTMKGIRNICNGNASTSTLNQQHDCFITSPASPMSLPYAHNVKVEAPTLEEMMLQVEIEEQMARKKRTMDQHDYYDNGMMRHRMSCVNSSDILRSARNALNQYPRFSLDGRDAMYRSSFRCCDHGIRERMAGFDWKTETKCLPLPSTLGGESVVWCKPGVVAKLMGLEAMPVPVTSRERKQTVSSITKRQSHRRGGERHGIERRLVININSRCDGNRREKKPCCSKSNGYCVMKPVAVESAIDDGGGWPTRCIRT